MSRRGPGSRRRTRSAMSAFLILSPPRRSASDARGTPKSRGCQTSFRNDPSATFQTVVEPVVVISSSPSEPCTRYCVPSFNTASVPAIRSPRSSPGTPINCAVADAGLQSGPIRFRTVRTFNSERIGAACFSAGCSSRAKRNPIPASRMQAPILSAEISTVTPIASRTSALPHNDDAERLPCLATFTPQPATTNAATVEILNVFRPSPPVPQVSSDGPGPASTRTIASRIASAKPVNSSTVASRGGTAARNAAKRTGETEPASMSRIAVAESASERASPRNAA